MTIGQRKMAGRLEGMGMGTLYGPGRSGVGTIFEINANGRANAAEAAR